MSEDKKGKEDIKEDKKKIKSPSNIILLVVLIMIGLIYIEFKKDDTMGVPDYKELTRIEIIYIVGEVGTNKTIIKAEDMEEFLEILKSSKIVNSKQSLSDFPDEQNFTIISCYFKEGGTSWRSLYQEDGENLIDLPYAGIYKIEEDKLKELNKIIQDGDKEEVSVGLDEILK